MDNDINTNSCGLCSNMSDLKTSRKRQLEENEYESIYDENFSLICHERWNIDRLNNIKQLINIPKELSKQLNVIKIDQNNPERFQVKYSTKKGDVKGRLYGNIIYTKEIKNDNNNTVLEEEEESPFKKAKLTKIIETNGGVSLQG